MPVTLRSKDVRIVSVDEIRPNERNRNSHPPEQIDRLCKIIEYQGFRTPLIVSNQSGKLVSGHGRLLAAKKLGLKELPVLFQDFESSDQEMAAGISDNAVSAWAELDLSGINLDLGDLGPDFDIDLLGIEDFVIEPADKLDPGCDEDEVPDHVEPNAKLGDIYRLGNHRLMCGDSTDFSAVEKLMNGELADLVFTDPPYNVNYKGSDGQKIQNDNMDEAAFSQFCSDFYSNYFTAMKPGASIYVFHADLMGDHFRYNFKKSGFHLSSTIIWNKNSLVMGRSDYHWKHEPCLYGWKPGAAHEWYSDRKQNTVFDFQKGSGQDNKMHPTCKPVGLVEYFINNSSKKNDLIIDLFGGSGSTLISAEKNNRRCFMSEIDPHYVDVIIARWEKYSGQKAELING